MVVNISEYLVNVKSTQPLVRLESSLLIGQNTPKNNLGATDWLMISRFRLRIGPTVTTLAGWRLGGEFSNKGKAEEKEKLKTTPTGGTKMRPSDFFGGRWDR